MAFFHCHQKALEFLVLISKSLKDLNFCHIYELWLTGNRTLCRPIRSVIILVVKQIRLLLHGCLILLTWSTCLIQTKLDFTQPYHHYKYNVFVLICVAEVAHLAMSFPCRQVTQVWLLPTWVFFLCGCTPEAPKIIFLYNNNSIEMLSLLNRLQLFIKLCQFSCKEWKLFFFLV